MRRGFTLVELVLAIGLLSILVLALIRLVDTSTAVWSRTETRREVSETASSVLDLLARDLSTVEGGRRGDLVAEWTRWDTDGDGVSDRLWPRLRLVRQAAAEDLLRVDPDATLDPRALGLLEVAWTVVPSRSESPDTRTVGVLLRGERRRAGTDGISFFDERFFDASGKPPGGTLEEVVGGCLWLELAFASQTSIVRDGWRLGSDPADCASAWDARGRGRPDPTETERNELAAGARIPEAHETLPLLPRRVRIELELERPGDLRRRARLTAEVDPEEAVLEVTDERFLPPRATYVLVDEEWMEVLQVLGRRVSVRRGARSSRPAFHEPGALVHHGWRLTREVPIALAREEWSF